MKKKQTFVSISIKLGITLMISILCGIVVFLGANELIEKLLNYYLDHSDYQINAEMQEIREFETWVKANDIDMTDSEQLQQWCEDNDMISASVSQGEDVLFGMMYSGEIISGTNETYSDFLKEQAAYLFPVQFSDGTAQVYLYNNPEGKLYNIEFAIAIAAGVVVSAIIFGAQGRRLVRAAKQLHKEVQIITSGNLDHEICLEQNDELGDLADGLNEMRCSLREKERNEAILKKSQEQLMVGMAHDLRTPLTALLTNMELLQRTETDPEHAQYVEKAISKVYEIRDLSDQMFDFLYETNNQEAVLSEPEDAQYALGDALSELCMFIEQSGFVMEYGNLEFRPVNVCVNLEYVSRIFNNLLSNIQKYADPEKPVHLRIGFPEGGVLIVLENAKREDVKHQHGSGIGERNMILLMDKMGGEFLKKETEMSYCARLLFPTVSEENGQA